MVFDEYMDRASVRSAFSLNPRKEGGLKLSWFGRRLTVRPALPLPADRTWTLELGSSAQDLAGNHLAGPLRVPFSTGDVLDTLALHLELSPAELGGKIEFWIWPMMEAPRRRFGLAPWRSSPDEEGRALFQGLPAGSWFALAVEDLNRDGWWDPRNERAGLPCRTLFAPDSASRGPALFHLDGSLRPDTLSLDGGQFLDRQRIQLGAWLEPPFPPEWLESRRRGHAADSLRVSLLELTDGAGGHQELAGLARTPEGWILHLAKAADSVSHVLRLRDGSDSLLLKPPAASYVGGLVDPRSLSQAWTAGVLHLTPLLAADLSRDLVWQEADGDSLPVAVTRGSSLSLELRPSRAGGQLLFQRGFLTRGERLWPDSLLTLPIPAPPSATSMGGLQWSWDRSPREANWRLMIRAGDEIRELPMAYGGSMDQLPAGKSLFAIYQDRDQSQSWSAGRLHGEPAEPWVVLPDTLEVLPGWIQGNIQFHLPEWIP